LPIPQISSDGIVRREAVRLVATGNSSPLDMCGPSDRSANLAPVRDDAVGSRRRP
jgi:hypothetical protein